MPSPSSKRRDTNGPQSESPSPQSWSDASLMRIHVEHQDIDGTTRITVFERGMARLIAHEVDHLHGVLYRERMNDGVQPIPVTEYKGAGRRWDYN